jgi:hypothetical protein
LLPVPVLVAVLFDRGAAFDCSLDFLRQLVALWPLLLQKVQKMGEDPSDVLNSDLVAEVDASSSRSKRCPREAKNSTSVSGDQCSGLIIAMVVYDSTSGRTNGGKDFTSSWNAS